MMETAVQSCLRTLKDHNIGSCRFAEFVISSILSNWCLYWFFFTWSINIWWSACRHMVKLSVPRIKRTYIFYLWQIWGEIYTCFVSSRAWGPYLSCCCCLFIWNSVPCIFSRHDVRLYFIHKVFCQQCVLCGMQNAPLPWRDPELQQRDCVKVCVLCVYVWKVCVGEWLCMCMSEQTA